MAGEAKDTEGEFLIGQSGEFLLRDAAGRPVATIRGEIVSLLAGKDCLYALFQTEEGLRPGRLA